MIRPSDSTYPNPPIDTPSPLMHQTFSGFGLPWPRKPLGKPNKGKPGPKTTRSGVHKLGRKYHRMY